MNNVGNYLSDVIVTKNPEIIIDPSQGDESIYDAAYSRAALLSNYLHFTQTFYQLIRGRKFIIDPPMGRESHYSVISRGLNHVFAGSCKKLLINVPPRYGKAVDINTPMLTKNGWKIAKDVEIGDELVGSSGWVKVKGVYPQGVLKAKKVMFNDNQSIVCNSEHLWSVCDRYTPKFKTFTTQHIEKTIYEADGRKHWRIPLVDGKYGDIEPFIDPYLFGCWLGDGHSSGATITTMDKDIVSAFKEHGHTMIDRKSDKCGKAKTYGIINNGFHLLLRKNNLINNKHIPSDVYRWSKQGRLSLLQGLMDTDGTCNKKNGQVTFCNKNQNIINGFCYLVNSLGGVYRIYNIKSGSKNVNIRLPDGTDPFRLKRKQILVPRGIKCSPRRFISNISETESCEMVCFSVDADDSLFAAGKGLILTHNTEMIVHFIAWSLAHFPDSNFLYVSVSREVAVKATSMIKDLLTSPYYNKIFGVSLRTDSKAKSVFTTTQGGSIEAVGAKGAIVGRGAGIRGIDDRFGGVLIIDDFQKPTEVTKSDRREEAIERYHHSITTRRNNGSNTPLIYIGQRLHEADLADHLIRSKQWKTIILPALDLAGNALCPRLHTTKILRQMQADQKYIFAAHFQQNPIPAGGALYETEDFLILSEDPDIIKTFITVDCAETAKTYNDATVFSLWGLYKIKHFGTYTGKYALHWLDCVELFVEPYDLEASFMSFYASSSRHGKLPMFAGIEKKSTGTTLASVLGKIQGMRVLPIERSGSSGSKSDRYIRIQEYVKRKLITLPYGAQHTKMCIDHMTSITANESERRNDIVDTAFDACNLTFINGVALTYFSQDEDKNIEIATSIKRSQEEIRKNRAALWGQ